MSNYLVALTKYIVLTSQYLASTSQHNETFFQIFVCSTRFFTSFGHRPSMFLVNYISRNDTNQFAPMFEIIYGIEVVSVITSCFMRNMLCLKTLLNRFLKAGEGKIIEKYQMF